MQGWEWIEREGVTSRSILFPYTPWMIAVSCYGKDTPPVPQSRLLMLGAEHAATVVVSSARTRGSYAYQDGLYMVAPLPGCQTMRVCNLLLAT